MGLKILVLVLLIKIVVARIKLDVNVDNEQKANISYSGTETHLVTDDDINILINRVDIIRAVEVHKNNHPGLINTYEFTKNDFFYKNCDNPNSRFIKEHPLKKVTSIKSASVKSLTKQPVVVVSQDFENSLNHTLKVNTGISYNIENTLTTTWSREQHFDVSGNIEYNLNVGILSSTGKTGFSFTTKGGVSEEKSKTETIGTIGGMELELKPGEAVTAVLSANAGSLEIEVVHMASLYGYMGIYLDYWNWTRENPFNYFGYCDLIERIMESGNMTNEITTTETIRFNFYVEPKLKVYIKKNGL